MTFKCCTYSYNPVPTLLRRVDLLVVVETHGVLRLLGKGFLSTHVSYEAKYLTERRLTWFSFELLLNVSAAFWPHDFSLCNSELSYRIRRLILHQSTNLWLGRRREGVIVALEGVADLLSERFLAVGLGIAEYKIRTPIHTRAR